VPPGRATRPTSDRVREALFSSLAADVPGARVLDLYAGSGALGIEALSRGAASAVLVEQDPRTVRVLRENLERTGLSSRAVVVREDAARFCRDPRDRGPFDVVLVDAPYREPLGVLYRLIGDLRAAGALVAGAVVVLERQRRDPSLANAAPPWLVHVRDRAYGDTVLRYLRAGTGWNPEEPTR
jgi:16S rRNA (guanine966-N2)-methyltransferase